jgi:hypothetical protein
VFTLDFSGSPPAVVPKKSKLSCATTSPKNKKFDDYTIQGEFGMYTVSGMINPDRIYKATFGE